MKRIASLLLAACLLAAPQLTGKAQAEGFALSDFGARGTALAGGMVARADDPSAVAWNPAGITQLPGTQIMVGMMINGMKTSGKKRDNLGSIGKSFRRGCNSIAESATKKEGNHPSFFVGG